MGHFLQTPRLSTSIDPKRGEGVRKHSASTSPFLSGSPLLIGPQLEMPAQESTTCRAPLPWSFRSREAEQRPGGVLQAPPAQPSGQTGKTVAPSRLPLGQEGTRGAPPGVVSPWPAAHGHLALHSPALVSAAPAGSGSSAQEQWSHSSSLGCATMILLVSVGG